MEIIVVEIGRSVASETKPKTYVSAEQGVNNRVSTPLRRGIRERCSSCTATRYSGGRPRRRVSMCANFLKAPLHILFESTRLVPRRFTNKIPS